jgi:hypothetical protein
VQQQRVVRQGAAGVRVGNAALPPAPHLQEVQPKEGQRV